MRTLSAWEQEERKRKLLQALIHEYIRTGKPVGSATLVDRYKLDLSPASIRNMMAELEDSGYLTHPHTSAGRTPTDKAYRYYVDSLVELQRLALIEEDRIRHEYETRTRQVEELLSTTSRTLSAMSRFTGFVVGPALDVATLRHIELIPLEADQVLAVLVADSGTVRHQVVQLNQAYPRDLLPGLSRLLNERLRGRAFSEAKDRILDEIEHIGQRQLDLIALARGIAGQLVLSDEGEVYLEGASNMLSLPDFRDFEHVRSLASLIDEKRLLGEVFQKELLDDASRAGEVKVRIGAESAHPAFRDLSVVSATYTIQDRKVGVLGIIGPKRMEYSRMMSLVSAVAGSVTKVLGRLVGGKG